MRSIGIIRILIFRLY